MQQFSRLASTATRSYSLFQTQNQTIRRGFARELTGRPVETETAAYTQREHELQPASRVGKPEETTHKHEPDTAKRETETAPGNEPKYTASAKPPRAAFPRLMHVGVKNPGEPIFQQKRNNSTSDLKDVSCAGLDGTPWPKEWRDRQIQEDSKSDIDYFEHHKPSPLSEIRLADTRKPITRETDGTVTEQDLLGVKDAVGWRPEQLDTAEESLERASRIFRENAMRGDPDSPHGRVLRELRGEWF